MALSKELANELAVRQAYDNMQKKAQTYLVLPSVSNLVMFNKAETDFKSAVRALKSLSKNYD